ncbi:MAG: hypothetical protein J6V09_04025 [Clostridia bacterium]|nr:hypothetical protein [Clostridia bacterium]
MLDRYKFGLYSLRATSASVRLALRAMSRQCRNARGATVAASLTSELADSALLGYLRRRCATAQEGANLSFSAKRKSSYP